MRPDQITDDDTAEGDGVDAEWQVDPPVEDSQDRLGDDFADEPPENLGTADSNNQGQQEMRKTNAGSLLRAARRAASMRTAELRQLRAVATRVGMMARKAEQGNGTPTFELGGMFMLDYFTENLK